MFAMSMRILTTQIPSSYHLIFVIMKSWFALLSPPKWILQSNVRDVYQIQHMYTALLGCGRAVITRTASTFKIKSIITFLSN